MFRHSYFFADYQGRVLLIVNTAAGCSFTLQYEGLQCLYKRYQSQGLEIFDFPVISLEIRYPKAMKRLQIFSM